MPDLGAEGMAAETPSLGYVVVSPFLTVSAPLADVVVEPRYEAGINVVLEADAPAIHPAGSQYDVKSGLAGAPIVGRSGQEWSLQPGCVQSG